MKKIRDIGKIIPEYVLLSRRLSPAVHTVSFCLGLEARGWGQDVVTENRRFYKTELGTCLLSDIDGDLKESLLNICMLLMVRQRDIHFIIILECLGKKILKAQGVITLPATGWKQQNGIVERITFTSSVILSKLLTLPEPLCPNL